MDKKVKNEDILLLFCEKNSDGTKHLRLRGQELQQRFGGRLEARHMKHVAQFMRHHLEIITVDFSYNNFGDKGLKYLSELYFHDDNNMQVLNLIHCDITAAGMEYLSSSKFLKLKKCKLNGNKIGALGARFIARLIEQCRSLLYLDIAETDLTLESVESVLIVIEHSTLTGLNISRIIPNSYYTKYNRAILADDLSVVLKLNESLKELVIQKVGFDGHDVDLLLNGLTANKTLQLLDISCNKLSDFGAEIIAEWLKTRPNLRGLNVAANSIGSYGARALSYALPFSKIRYFNISRNRLDDWGLSDLLDSIKKSHQMRLFFIWGNTIGPVSCKRLQRMFASGVLQQDFVDVKIYEVDGELHAAEYPSNHWQQNFYGVMDYGCPVELKIVKNKIYPENSLPRQLFNFENIGRIPPIDKALGLKMKKEKICP